MQRFFATLLEGRLTSAAMLKELISPQMVAAQAKGGSPELDYRFGFGVGAVCGHRWFGHNGGAPGVNTEAAAYPDDRNAEFDSLWDVLHPAREAHAMHMLGYLDRNSRRTCFFFTNSPVGSRAAKSDDSKAQSRPAPDCDR